MKINIKIILPIIALLCIILAAFGYLLFYLKYEEQIIDNQTEKFQQLNLMSSELTKEQETIEYNVLVYRFNLDKNVLSAIDQSDINIAQITDKIYPYINSETGRKLVSNYIEARKNIENVRGDLLKAIASKKEDDLNQKYAIWSAQTQAIRQTIIDLDNYNLTVFNLILNSFNSIYNKLFQVILILIVIVVVSIFVLFYYLKYTISNPIIKLSIFSDEIANKNFTNISEHINPENLNNTDEIDRLFQDFLTMSQKLKTAYDELEQNVKERTQALTIRTFELEESQKATMNILEDLNMERKSLMETKALDEAVLASIGEGLAVVDKFGAITYINDAFELITGWKRDEVLGKILVDILPSQAEDGTPIPNENRFISRILSGENPENDFVNTVYYLKKDGTRFPIQSLVKRITLNGELIGAVKTFTDATKIKDIDQAKTEFVSLAAHQLRTPLSAIGWYSEMLLSGDAGELNELQKKYLQQIYDGNARMVNMVKSFLNVSRIELGTMTLDLELVDLRKLVDDVAEEQEQKIEQKKINLSLNYQRDLPAIVIDPKRIRMVIENLLSNAIKYTEERGKVEITISSGQENKNILFKISDTGFGIPENAKPKIFGKLFRAENAVEKATEGTGLGLYIVKSIINESMGQIWFESLENKGTTFFVSLPIDPNNS